MMWALIGENSGYLMINSRQVKLVGAPHQKFIIFLEMVYLRLNWSHLGHIGDYMPVPDGSCGIRTHDSWILRHGPYSLFNDN